MQFPIIKFLKHLSSQVWVFLILTIISVFFVAHFVNLQPQVDENFFFSSDDPQFQSEVLISTLFIRKDTQLIISATGDIHSPQYIEKIKDLSVALLALDRITSVNSLTHFGPSSLKDALKSPLWKRLIISDDKKSSNLIVLLDEAEIDVTVPKIKEIMEVFDSAKFRLRAAGLPYVLELLRRNLAQDLKVFSILAFIIFGLIIFKIFHSRYIVLGTLISCLNACMLTLMITHLKEIPMGLLTANLGTIVFVLTLSHIIFLTYSWKKIIATGTEDSPVQKAVQRTFPASFWSMLTTLLGFLSLLSVPAKPLRDLGVAGAIGTIVAMIAAYGIFPPFLRLVNSYHSRESNIDQFQINIYCFLERRKSHVILIILVACLLAFPGIWMIDSDPSLLSYFSKKSEIYEGFSYIDRNGGSSPLILVVRSQTEEKLNTKNAYQQLWDLQESLEKHRSVGSVISLPVLIAQAKSTPFGFFLSREWLLDIMEKPEYDEIAKSFVTEDRRYGLYLLRMNESNRTMSRLQIIDEIKEIALTQGLYPAIIGGMYNLQGHLSKLVTSSLVFGLGKLILIFFIIAWIICGSIRIALAVTLSITLVPLSILGLIGVYRIPLDIICAPASNIAIAMGIDSMIHMLRSYRRCQSWQEVRNQLWQPILTTMFVVSVGFAIFLFSTFPPTQRFGAAIVFGTILASLTALYVMPLFAEYLDLTRWKIVDKRQAEEHPQSAA